MGTCMPGDKFYKNSLKDIKLIETYQTQVQKDLLNSPDVIARAANDLSFEHALEHLCNK